MIRLTVEETNLLSIYNEGGKRALIENVNAALPYIDVYKRQSLTCSIPLLITSPKRVPFSFVIRPLGASNSTKTN